MAIEPNNKPMIPFGDEGVVINDIDAAFRFAQMYLQSGLAPTGYKNPQQMIIALVRARELKLPYLQAMEGMSVINGRIGLMGDLALSLVERSGELEDKRVRYSGEGDELCCTVVLKRKGREWKEWSFSVLEAKQAGIFERSAVWRQYPKRMTYYRALGFALRDEFGNILRGMQTTEELADYPSEETPRRRKYDLAKPAPPSTLAPEAIPMGGKDEAPPAGELTESKKVEFPAQALPPERALQLRTLLERAGIEERKALAVLASPLVRLASTGTTRLEDLDENALDHAITDFDGLVEMTKSL